MLKGTIYKNYVKPATLYDCEALCLKENKIGILQKTKRSMVRTMCRVQLKDKNELRTIC